MSNERKGFYCQLLVNAGQNAGRRVDFHRSTFIGELFVQVTGCSLAITMHEVSMLCLERAELK